MTTRSRLSLIAIALTACVGGWTNPEFEYAGPEESDDDGLCEGGLAPVTFYGDADGDGFGNVIYSRAACEKPRGWVTDDTDCDDTDPDVFPGAAERCNEVDDDCDGDIDEFAMSTWYEDADDDGWGLDTSTTQACTRPPHTSSVGGDCDDTDPEVGPGGEEVCNGIDDDCDGEIDDVDSESEGAIPVFEDTDLDGYGSSAARWGCAELPGWVLNEDDCDDTNPEVHPDALEVCDNGLDDDCDGLTDEEDVQLWYEDADGDTYGTITSTLESCAQPESFVAEDGDCDDTDASVVSTSQSLPVSLPADLVGSYEWTTGSSSSTSWIIASDGGFKGGGSEGTWTYGCPAEHLVLTYDSGTIYLGESEDGGLSFEGTIRTATGKTGTWEAHFP